jgi:hypothetical protein
VQAPNWVSNTDKRINVASISPIDLANLLSSQPITGRNNWPIPLQRSGLAKEIAKFHISAGTLTGDVRARLAAFEAGASIVRIAHQPNFLGYWRLFAQPVFLDELVQALSRLRIPAVGVFVTIDHDIVTNRRWRGAHYPSVQHLRQDLVLSLGLRCPPYRLIAQAERPSPNRVLDMLSALKTCVMTEIRIAKRLGISDDERLSRFEVLCSDVLEAFDRARGVGEFTTILLSRIVNLRMNLNTLFLPGMQFLRHAQNHLRSLLDERDLLNEVQQRLISELSISSGPGDRLELPWLQPSAWVLCRNCGSRVRLDEGAFRYVTIKHDCPYCAGRIDISMRPDSESDLLIPKVLLDDMLDVVALGAVGGCGYLGNAEHCLISNGILGSMKLPFAEALWSPIGGPPTLTEVWLSTQGDGVKGHATAALRNLVSGAASVAHSMVDATIGDTAAKWAAHLRRGNPMESMPLTIDTRWSSDIADIAAKQRMRISEGA